jgi:hypothetical protein
MPFTLREKHEVGQGSQRVPAEKDGGVVAAFGCTADTGRGVV